MYQSESAPWLEFYAWNTDGSAKTDLVFNTAGIAIVVVRDNLANSAALTLSAASGPTDWAAGKFWPMGGNKYRVGIATASISSFTGQISVEGTYTGGVITGVTREVSAYNPSGNPNTIAPATPTNVSDVQTAILAKLPAALESGRIAAALDSATQTQIDNIEATLTTLGSESTTVERSVSDTNAITFSWPVSGATITGTLSLNNGAYGAVAGAIAFLRTETGRHYYTLAYNAADRTSAEGQVRYKFVDGTYTGYVVLRTVNLVTVAQVNAQVLDVLSVDTFAELSAPPAATSSLKDKITWLFMYARNKVTQTSSQRKLYRDDTTTVAGTSGTSDNGTTFTKGEDS